MRQKSYILQKIFDKLFIKNNTKTVYINFKNENIVITKQFKITNTSLISNLQPPTFLREKTKEKGLLYLPLVKATLV